jgi:hypothetical protein
MKPARMLLACATFLFAALPFNAAPNCFAQDSSASGTEPSAERHKLDLDKPKPLVMTRDFAARGTLVLDMNVGDVRIARNPEGNKIRLEIQPEHFGDEAAAQGWVRQFDVAGDRATIRVHMPSHRNNGIQLVLYVPEETALKLDLGVGDLRVSHIRGDKTLHVGIGDLIVGLGDAAEYGQVDNAVKLGDVHDQVNGVERDGFFNAENRRAGGGPYHLRARVGIGDLTLQKEDKL